MLPDGHLDIERSRIKVVSAPGGARLCLDRYDDVAAAFKDRRFGAATAPQHLIAALRWSGFRSIADVGACGIMVALNPPDHTRLRKIADPIFRSTETAAMTRQIQKIAGSLAARIPDGAPFDLIADFAAPLPTRVITELIGFPLSDMPNLARWTEILAPLIDSDLQKSSVTKSIAAFLAFRRRILVLAQERLRAPQDDLLSSLAHAHYVSGELTEAEVVGTTIFVLSAGHATTTHLIGTGVLELLRTPSSSSACAHIRSLSRMRWRKCYGSTARSSGPGGWRRKILSFKATIFPATRKCG